MCKVIESRIKRSLLKYKLFFIIFLDSLVLKELEEDILIIGDVVLDGYLVEREVIRKDIL